MTNETRRKTTESEKPFIVGLLVGGVIGMIIMGYLCASDKGRVL